MSDARGTCPAGGQWYECTTGTTPFFGCCNSDPCQNDAGCPASDLEPAGLGTNSSSEDGSFATCSAGLWWTCSANTPSFQGCCDTDPCAHNGCPSGQLHAAFFRTIPPELATAATSSNSAAATSSGSTATDSSPIPTSTPLTDTTTTTSQPAAATTPHQTTLSAAPTGTSTVSSQNTGSASVANIVTSGNSPSPSSSSSSLPAIVGGAVGGISLIALIAAAVFFLRRRKRRNRLSSQPMSDLVTPTPFTPKPYGDEDLFPPPAIEVSRPRAPLTSNPYDPNELYAAIANLEKQPLPQEEEAHPYSMLYPSFTLTPTSTALPKSTSKKTNTPPQIQSTTTNQ
ncbi:hypothetical protein G7Y89_g5091 [Cudoniella acicularis]|uniref:Uncharacterized protein n=1 Tax=Cudoniella acicularis TaxID=354080 RepID=A0A8H4RN56_9HELO|nr:hypothetical protein G7Y89_g5091 [Cudoniella acicularis]